MDSTISFKITPEEFNELAALTKEQIKEKIAQMLDLNIDEAADAVYGKIREHYGEVQDALEICR